MDQVGAYLGAGAGRQVTTGVAWGRLELFLGVLVFFFTAQHFNTPWCFCFAWEAEKVTVVWGYEHLFCSYYFREYPGSIAPCGGACCCRKHRLRFFLLLSLPGWMSRRAGGGEETSKQASSV
jgi:hypothetical protein